MLRGRVLLYAAGCVLALGTFALALGASAATGRELAFFTRDPLAETSQPLYTGFVSYVGVLVWWAGAVAALLGAAWARGTRLRRSLAFAGAFTALLALDDLFQLHENGIPDWTGLPEAVVYGVYGLLFVAFAWMLRPLLDRQRLVALAAACVFLAVSVVADLPHGEHQLLEEGAKLLGIAIWTALLLEIVDAVAGPRAPTTERGAPAGAPTRSPARPG